MWEDIKELAIGLFICVLVPILFLQVATCALAIANNHWNCSTWAKATGEDTKMIAGACYVKEGNSWISFDTHVKNNHVEVKSR
jgi:hypothetical protein